MKKQTLLQAELRLLAHFNTIKDATASLPVNSPKYKKNKALLDSIENYITIVGETKGKSLIPSIRSLVKVESFQNKLAS